MNTPVPVALLWGLLITGTDEVALLLIVNSDTVEAPAIPDGVVSDEFGGTLFYVS